MLLAKLYIILSSFETRPVRATSTKVRCNIHTIGSYRSVLLMKHKIQDDGKQHSGLRQSKDH